MSVVTPARRTPEPNRGLMSEPGFQCIQLLLERTLLFQRFFQLLKNADR